MTEEQRRQNRIKIDYTNMTDKYLKEKGYSAEALESLRALSEQAYGYVSGNRGKDELYMGWTELPYNQKEIVADILKTAVPPWRSTRSATCTITTCPRKNAAVPASL